MSYCNLRALVVVKSLEMHQNVAMNLEVILSFLHSFALFGIFGIGVYFIQRNRPLFGEILSDALNGLLLGLAAFLVTVTPIVFEDGATFRLWTH
jgi:hypothetical protein